MAKPKITIRNITSIFILSLVFAVIQLFGGLLTNSIAILTDCIRNFGDAISIGIALMLEKKAMKHADNKYTYGYFRFSVVASLISTMFMIVSSIFAIIVTVPRLLKPENVNDEGMFFLAVFGLVINGMNHYSNYKTDNINEQSVNMQQTEDLLSWVGILIVSTVISIYDLNILDPILSLLIVCLTFKHIINHLKHIFDILLEKVPDDLSIEDIEKKILKIKHVVDVRDFHVWSLDGIRDCASVFIVISDDLDLKSVLHVKSRVKKIIRQSGIKYSTVEIITDN